MRGAIRILVFMDIDISRYYHTYTYIHSTVDRDTVLGIAPLHRRNHSDLNCTIAPKKSQIHTYIHSTVDRDIVLGIAPLHPGIHTKARS